MSEQLKNKRPEVKVSPVKKGVDLFHTLSTRARVLAEQAAPYAGNAAMAAAMLEGSHIAAHQIIISTEARPVSAAGLIDVDMLQSPTVANCETTTTFKGVKKQEKVVISDAKSGATLKEVEINKDGDEVKITAPSNDDINGDPSRIERIRVAGNPTAIDAEIPCRGRAEVELKTVAATVTSTPVPTRTATVVPSKTPTPTPNIEATVEAGKVQAQATADAIIEAANRQATVVAGRQQATQVAQNAFATPTALAKERNVEATATANTVKATATAAVISTSVVATLAATPEVDAASAVSTQVAATREALGIPAPKTAGEKVVDTAFGPIDAAGKEITSGGVAIRQRAEGFVGDGLQRSLWWGGIYLVGRTGINWLIRRRPGATATSGIGYPGFWDTAAVGLGGGFGSKIFWP